MLYINKSLQYIDELYNPPEDSLPVTDTMEHILPLCFGGHLTIYEKKFCPVFSMCVPSFTYVENIIFFTDNILCEEILQGIFICLERGKNSLHVRIEGT